MSEQPPAPSKSWNLGPESEYRFELDPGTSLAIKLVKGQAEIFGFELVEGMVHLFGFECKAAVYTWRGCVIEISEPSTEYISGETPMKSYANLHIALEQMRVRALRQLRGSPVPPEEASKKSEPPRVLVLGPEDSGKTSLCKILANYAVRMGQGWSPFLVNVNPSECAWAAPGTVAAAQINGPIPTATPTNAFGNAATTAPLSLSSNSALPLLYWYGHREIKRNPLLIDRMVRNLGENISDRCDSDIQGQASGLILDTPPSLSTGPASNSHRHMLIKACIDAFKINMIVVVGNEKLNVEMQRTYGSQLDVVKVPKSGGVVELDHSYRERVENYALHGYMYGQSIKPPNGITKGTLGGENLSELVLSPSSSVINFSDLQIYRIGAESMAPSDALPVGAARTVSEMQPVQIDPSSPGSGLLNSVLALLAPQHEDENERYDEEILDLAVVGFLIVTNIDIPKRKMTVLAPNRGNFSGRVAVIGSFEWQDQ